MKYAFLICIALSIFSCTEKDNDPGTTSQAKTLKNESYGADAKQKFDIYLPANRSAGSTPVAFMIHGGGWNEGDKADFDPSVTALQQLLPNYAVVNINYRLVVNNTNLFPAQENDVKAAVEYVYSKRAEYNISDKWAFIGASAGGHLALLQAYKYPLPVKAKAVVSFFGPTELISLYNNPPTPLINLLLVGVTGTTPALNPTIYSQSSPYNFATAQAPPTMLLQGGTDPLVPASQSILMRDKLNTLGVQNEYVFYPLEGHGWTGLPLLDSFDKIKTFLNKHVQ
ncbi:MAG: alpha/beta hydrolase [Gemmatimonadaceae bacterium]|nr:alpha/beta hydrolase [Chitinophagaceae bacterium]